MQWLRRSFVTGFFVTVPLFVSVAAVIWIFNVVDGLTTPLYDRLLGRRIPGATTRYCVRHATGSLVLVPPPELLSHTPALARLGWGEVDRPDGSDHAPIRF